MSDRSLNETFRRGLVAPEVIRWASSVSVAPTKEIPVGFFSSAY